MTTKAISVTELKQNLGEIVNQASYGGTRFILLSHGKERAALISLEDLRLLENLLEESRRELVQNRQLNLLADARQLRESGEGANYSVDSTLEEVREERLDELTDLR
jgi:prevent-host-death family protein